jgi:hypothetical protein
MDTVRQYVVMVADCDATGWHMVPATHRLFTAEEAARYARRELAVSRHPRILTAAEYLRAFCNWRLHQEV